MDSNDDFYGKELNLNYFYMHTNFGQKYLKTAIVRAYLVTMLKALGLRSVNLDSNSWCPRFSQKTKKKHEKKST